jgi:hypothetical protein
MPKPLLNIQLSDLPRGFTTDEPNAPAGGIDPAPGDSCPSSEAGFLRAVPAGEQTVVSTISNFCSVARREVLAPLTPLKKIRLPAGAHFMTTPALRMIGEDRVAYDYQIGDGSETERILFVRGIYFVDLTVAAPVGTFSALATIHLASLLDLRIRNAS